MADDRQNTTSQRATEALAEVALVSAADCGVQLAQNINLEAQPMVAKAAAQTRKFLAKSKAVTKKNLHSALGWMDFSDLPVIGDKLENGKVVACSNVHNMANAGFAKLDEAATANWAAVSNKALSTVSDAKALGKYIVSREVRDPVVHKFLRGDVHFGPEYEATSDGTFCGDCMFFFKNNHELISVCCAHKYNPMKRTRRLIFVLDTWLFALFFQSFCLQLSNCKTFYQQINDYLTPIVLMIFSTILESIAKCACCSGDGFVVCRKFWRWLGKLCLGCTFIACVVMMIFLVTVFLPTKTWSVSECVPGTNPDTHNVTSCICYYSTHDVFGTAWRPSMEGDEQLVDLPDIIRAFFTSKALQLFVYGNAVVFGKFVVKRWWQMRKTKNTGHLTEGNRDWNLNPLEGLRKENGVVIDPITGKDRTASVIALQQVTPR